MKTHSFYLIIYFVVMFTFGCEQKQQVVAQQKGSLEVKENSKEVVDSSVVVTPQADLVYPWLDENQPNTWENTPINRIQPPDGYIRKSVEEGSFGEWLRFLPLKPIGSKVMYYNGNEKPYQNFHEAVIDIDIGSQDLQQCADATMRLRAEYLFAQKKFDQIKFNFTSGDPAYYAKWRQGYGIKIANNRLKWYSSSKANTSYQSFKRYMHWVFMYAGTASLSKEVQSINLKEMQIGDIIIQGGFPGHAVIIVDIAYHKDTGEKIFMLAQSYMPAQSIHILKNTVNTKLGAWFSIADCLEEGAILTPQWNFLNTDLGRFR